MNKKLVYVNNNVLGTFTDNVYVQLSDDDKKKLFI